MKILKKIPPFMVSVSLFLMLLQSIVFAGQIKAKFKVDGITWISTSAEAEAIPRRQKGVQSSEADLVDSSVTVIFDDTIISIENLKAILKKEGFPVVEEPLILK